MARFLHIGLALLGAGAATLGVSAQAQSGERSPRAVQTAAPRPQAADRQVSSNVYYPNCDAVRAAGAAPLYRGQPGYRPPLDRDGDGIACEPYRRR
jgi:hypothetical protein